MWTNTYDPNWSDFREYRPRLRTRPQDIELDVIVAEARRMRATENARFFVGLGRGLAWAWTNLIVAPTVRAYRRKRMERELSALNDEMLADIGVARADIRKIAQEAYRRREERNEPQPKTLYEVARAVTPVAVVAQPVPHVPTKRAA